MWRLNNNIYIFNNLYYKNIITKKNKLNNAISVKFYFQLNKINLNKLNFRLLKKKRNVLTILFNKFKLRIDINSFLSLSNYIYYFQTIKYFNYINLTVNKFCKILILFKNYIKFKWKTKYSNILILNKFNIYNKLIIVLKKQLHELDLNNFIENYNLKNNFKFNNWKKNINKLLRFQYKINYKRLNKNNCFYKIIQIILINYIDTLFFKFFNELNYYKYNINYKNLWIKIWIILKRNCIWDWIKFFLNNNKLKLNDLILWKIFYIRNHYFKILNKKILNIIINNEKLLLNNFVIYKNQIIYLHIILGKAFKTNNNIINIISRIKRIKVQSNFKFLYNYYWYIIKYQKYMDYRYNIVLIILFYYCYIAKTAILILFN